MSKVFSPRPWQPSAIRHLLNNNRSAIFLPPGLGKTSIVLRAINLINYTEPAFPILVLAPLRVARDTWREECQKWTFSETWRVSSVIGDEGERMEALRMPADIYTINYENVPWIVELYGKKWPFKTIVVDESSRIKNFRIRQGGQRARELYKVAWPYCRRLWQLTGSPCGNSLEDMYGPMMFLDQGERLGRTFDSFQKRWFQRNWSGFGLDPLPHAEKEITERIKDLCLSIDPKDWGIDVGKPIEITIPVTLPPDARKLYDQMEREMFITIEQEGIEAFNAGAKRNKAMQLAQGAVYLENGVDYKIVHDEKIKALDSLLEEASGMPLLVAYHYKHDLARLKKAFPHAVDLSTPEGLRKFKTGKVRMGLAHPASLGHGIDGLQLVTNIIVFFAHSDNLEYYQQIIERIGPMRQMQSGMDRNVYVYHIIGSKTVEEYAVLPNLQGKGELQDLIMKALRGIEHG